ncbi:MAG: GTP-binding protein [Myxococcota bacterium]|jgi:GTP-binding protein
MQFIDEVKIQVESGKGGNGSVSFRREKNVPRGGPNGGDGGKGGDVIFQCANNLNTLVDYRFQQYFKAQNGEGGKGSNCHGSKGNDLILQLPIGTQVFDDATGVLLVDMTEEGQETTIVTGGKGGFGNSRFKSSVNQAPRKALPGFDAEELELHLQLKLISDAGLVGLPNAGKSTFLSVTTRAKPKIANYPFTTLKPQLGVVYIDEKEENKEFVLADIPGLIKDASLGKGLGDKFLKHVERCGVILHLIDAASEDVALDYQTIRTELENYGEELKSKLEIIALNKIDLFDEDEIKEKMKILKKAVGKNKKIFAISGVAGIGIKPVLREIFENIIAYRKKSEEAEEGLSTDKISA